MSRVFLARDESLARDIVIKVLPVDLAAELSVERFTREIRLAAALQHPHLVPVISAGVAAGLPYYTMPFIRGDSLRAVIDKGGLQTDETLGVLRDLAKALRYAHKEGVVHRDIKPENVLMSSESALIADFGIAKALSAARTDAPGGTLTVVGTSIGTPAYMSPEQAAADPNIDHRSDIYAWGVIAYEMLARKHPFAGKTTPQQYLRAHLAEEPASLRKIAPTVPAAVSDIVMKALEKEPEMRPQSAGELLTALGGMTSGSTSGLTYAGKSLSWKVPAIAAAATLLLVTGFVAYRNRSAPTGTEIVMLAVLPFENKGSADQDYFVDGLTDAVNGKLASLNGMSVIDRRSSGLYRKTSKSVKEIGRELGVQFVLGGVVRWAKDSSGWRAQVTPTLVNTSNATTRWAGDPLVVSSDDPFSAQTEIATKVATALRLALGVDDQRDLAKRPTENAEAYDAFLRGKAITETYDRTSISVRSIDQAIAEFRRAVALDPKFANAWAYLTRVARDRAREVPGDTASMALAMYAGKKTEQLESDDPMVLAVKSRIAFDRGDNAGGMKIVTDALRDGKVSAELLVVHAFHLLNAGNPESAGASIQKALKLNPRSAEVLFGAEYIAELTKNIPQAVRYARAAIEIDPTDERGWSVLANLHRGEGDSAAIRSTLEEAFTHIPSPSNLLLTNMVYAGGQTGAKFILMTPEDLKIGTVFDSVATYYDNKADYYLGRRDFSKARIYHDSIIAKLNGRNLSGLSEPLLRMYLANAYAFGDRLVDARREMARAAKAAVPLREQLDRRISAVVLHKLGNTEGAVAEATIMVKQELWSRKGLAIEPKMQVLRGAPAFEAFLKQPEPVKSASR